jgi:hypothetical protein
MLFQKLFRILVLGGAVVGTAAAAGCAGGAQSQKPTAQKADGTPSDQAAPQPAATPAEQPATTAEQPAEKPKDGGGVQGW